VCRLVHMSCTAVTLQHAPVQVGPSSREQVTSALNGMGLALACAFLLPRALGGWDTQDAVALAAPLSAGWFLFDLTYLAGLLLQLQRLGVGGDGDDS
jgi:hypothetical protein